MPLVVLVSAASCREVLVRDEVFPNVEELTASPTPGAIRSSIVGMLAGLRSRSLNVEGAILCALGKECYLFGTDPRSIQLIKGPMEPGGFFGSLNDLGWSASYRILRQGAITLDLVDQVPDFTNAQKEGIRGFVKTVIGIELLLQIRIRDVSGIAVEYSADQSAPLPPIVSKEEALARIGTLLDEAQTHLQAAGTAFAFTLHAGFSSFGNFSTPAGFLQFNRGLRARLDIDRGDWNAALSALSQSFIDASSGTAATLARGAYHAFSAAAGDARNSLFDAVPLTLFVHPSILSGAQLRANGQPDLRLTQKTAVGTTRSFQGVTGTHRFTIYSSNVAPLPLLRNEELILMRAEARYHTGDVAGALQDINHIRVNSGGLAPLSGFSDASAFVDELLYNRMYSLLLERGNRWLDARRYGRLGQLPKLNADEKTFPYVMFPQVECDARTPKPQPGCSQVPEI
jgi:hypothetical protein